MKGNSKPNPNEYMIKSSVDEKVIDDIFKFITEWQN